MVGISRRSGGQPSLKRQRSWLNRNRPRKLVERARIVLA
jgi:hypothetical protein